MEHLIFEKPSLAPFPHRVGWAFFTALFWILWVYLWMPLLTLLGWALGLNAYTGFFADAGFFKMQQVGKIFILYTSVICVMGGSLLLWARVEFLRFHNVNRRAIPVPVRVDEIALHAKLSVEALECWTSSRRMVAHHDHHGRVIVKEGDKLVG